MVFIFFYWAPIVKNTCTIEQQSHNKIIQYSRTMSGLMKHYLVDISHHVSNVSDLRTLCAPRSPISSDAKEPVAKLYYKTLFFLIVVQCLAPSLNQPGPEKSATRTS
ncbi:hypothetical protein NQ315_005004 [Exocentrus adspersus]|uniref:Uncharacterized protein n=1 Tax=Exocentrus adspersus TaxID=1586481 RepID=A0AAV8VQ73_9CUCU|nr:hypothetical protein NQ315_005004 [Exocentrus adspersus]